MKTTFLLFTMVCLMSGNLSAQPGTLDSSFGINGDAKFLIEDSAYLKIVAVTTAIQDDGKIIIIGNMEENPYYPSRSFLARLNSDGTPDYSFGLNGKVVVDTDGTVNPYLFSIAVQKDGKILCGGRSNTNDFLLLRYNINGQRDLTFGINGQVITSVAPHSYGEIQSLAIQSDGKIIAGGDANTQVYMVRYNSDGSVDSSFNNGPYFLAAQSMNIKVLPDGKFLSLTDGYEYMIITRHLNNGTIDSTFGNNGQAHANFFNEFSLSSTMTLLKNNDIIVGGTAYSLDGTYSAIAKFKSNGSVDSSFGTNGFVATNYDGNATTTNSVLIQDDGKIINVARKYNEPTNFRIGRFLPNGTLDSSYGINGFSILGLSPYTRYLDDYHPITNGAAIQKDGQVIVVGYKDFGYFNAERIKGDEPIKISIKKNVALPEGNSGNSIAKFVVALNKPSTSDIKVNFTTKNGNALSGSDYISSSGSLTIKAGKVTKSVLVSVFGDNIKEPNEKFSLVLSNPVNAILGDLDSAICTIKNDDPLLVSNSSTEENINITETTSIKVYPNPVKDVLYLSGLSIDNETRLTIINADAKTLSIYKVNSATCNLHIKSLPTGTYFLKIESKTSKTILPFIKQ